MQQYNTHPVKKQEVMEYTENLNSKPNITLDRPKKILYNEICMQ